MKREISKEDTNTLGTSGTSDGSPFKNVDIGNAGNFHMEAFSFSL
jgi:hypothetical protein